MKFVCTKKCFYRDRVWVPGETLAPISANEKVPHHFKPSGEVKAEDLPAKPEPEKPVALSQLKTAEEDFLA